MTIQKNPRPAALRFAALLLATALLAVSCTENAPPKSTLNEKAIIPDGIAFTQVSPGVVNVNDPGNTAAGPGSVSVAPVQPSTPLPKEDIVVPPRRIADIVGGRRAVTPDTDLWLCRYFGLVAG